ncbi:hypothetical protein N7451_005699 [Penicillium sp. IBT 35674x]|nr:hypothetical protein N7451_005699 [Penicillium sp. IBT 35674x]
MTMLIIGRFIAGAAVGMLTLVVTMYAGKMAEASSRAPFSGASLSLSSVFLASSLRVTSILTKPSWWRRLILGYTIQAFGPLSGINVINYYGTRIYASLGIDTKTSLMIIGISRALSIVYYTSGLWALERVGRIKPLIIRSGGMALALVCDAAMSQHYDESNGNELRAIVAMNFLFSFFYTFIGIISWVYPAEVFPVDIRNQGNSVTTFTNWTINLHELDHQPGFRSILANSLVQHRIPLL